MPASPHEEKAHAGPPTVPAKTIALLEHLDNAAHVVVAVFFILMALSVLIYTGMLMWRQVPLLIAAMNPPPVELKIPPNMLPTGGGKPPETVKPGETGTAKLADAAKTTETDAAKTTETAKTTEADASKTTETLQTVHEPGKQDPFFAASLEILSSILFVVILLELLRTIITYLTAHDIRLIMQEFLVVGIISTVRKILLVGAQSSLSGENGSAFISEAYGTILSILGVLLLITGLIALKRAYGVEGSKTKENETGETHV